MKKWLWVVFLVTLALSGCQSGSSDTADTAEQAFIPPLVAQGYLEPVQYLDLAFSLPGPVEEVLVQERESVAQGQVLARLEGFSTRQAELERARLEVLSAEQALDALSPELSEAQAILAVADAGVALVEAQDQVEAVEDLDDPALLAQALAQLELLQVQLELAQARLEDLQNGVDPAQQAAAQRLITARASEQAAQTALEALELKAPWAGVVVGLSIQKGQFVVAGQKVLSLADFSSWVVKTDDLTELAVGRIFLGQKAAITLDALPEATLTGVVTDIAQRFEEKRGDVTYTVTLRLDDSATGLRWGMTSQVQFEE